MDGIQPFPTSPSPPPPSQLNHAPAHQDPNYDDDDEDPVNLLTPLIQDDLQLMPEVPWDLRGTSGANVETLSSDEELLDFSSEQTRLVLNSSSDDDLLNIASDSRAGPDNVTTDGDNPLTRCQWCSHLVRNHIGLLYALVSCVFFATGATCVKLLSEKVNPAEIIFWRFLFTLLLVLPPLIYTRPPIVLTKKQFLLLLCRSMSGATAVGLLYKACQMVSVGDANAIFFCNPIFTGLLACIFLKEGCTIWDVLLAIMSISGVFLITRPSVIFGDADAEEGSAISGKTQLVGSMVALAGAVVASLAFLSLRKIGKGLHFLTTVFYFSIFTLILSAILITSLQWWTLPQCGQDRLILLGTGALGFLGQMFLTTAFQREKAVYVSMVRTNDVTVAYILQYTVFGTEPMWTSIVGGILIMSSSIGISIRRRLAERPSNSNHGNIQEEPQMLNDNNINQVQESLAQD